MRSVVNDSIPPDRGKIVFSSHKPHEGHLIHHRKPSPEGQKSFYAADLVSSFINLRSKFPAGNMRLNLFQTQEAPLEPPVQIRVTEIIKIVEFQEALQLDDEDSFKLQQLIYGAKTKEQKNASFKPNRTRNIKIKARESLHEHLNTIISHSNSLSNFKENQEVQNRWYD
jgi:hypothetical protein